MARCRFTSKAGLAPGFTLVELLVVIAVISILAGLLLPALRQAVQEARKVACLSNLRQLAIASNVYADAYRGVIPSGVAGDGRLPSNSWSHAEWDDVFREAGQTEVVDGNLLCPRVASGCYGMNDHLSAEEGKFEAQPFGTAYSAQYYKFWGIRVGRTRAPSQTIFFADAANRPQAGTFEFVGGRAKRGGVLFRYTYLYDVGSPKHGIWLAHEGTANLLFADGHAATFRPRALLEQGIDAYYDTDGTPCNISGGEYPANW